MLCRSRPKTLREKRCASDTSVGSGSIDILVSISHFHAVCSLLLLTHTVQKAQAAAAQQAQQQATAVAAGESAICEQCDIDRC